MIVGDEFRDPPPQRIFAKPNHPIKARFLNRSDEAFRVGVRKRRQLHRIESMRSNVLR
jgi:hypothetical protein